MVIKKSKDMTADAQKNNFASIIAKQTSIFKKGRGERNSMQSFTSDQAQRLPYYASIKIPDVVNEVDLDKVRLQKNEQQKGYLDGQKKESKEVHEGGQFFGMTDQEILMNQEVFRKMGLIE